MNAILLCYIYILHRAERRQFATVGARVCERANGVNSRCGSHDHEISASYVVQCSYMPVSAVNGAAATAVDSELDDITDRSRIPVGWLNMMQAYDRAVEARLGRYIKSSSSRTAATAKNGDAATGEIKQRNCEGQLSVMNAANSCSSCKPANHTTEMAQEDYGPSWNNLPSVILQEIFLYLPQETRIKASQVCKNWRYTLFHPSFWKRIVFVFKDKDSVLWARFLAERFALSVQEVTIRWNTLSYIDFVGETCMLLNKLSPNKQLRKLILEFNGQAYAFHNNGSNYYHSRSLIKSVINIIKTSNCLEALSLGCTEELIENMCVILEPLHQCHAKHLTHLSLASVKNSPGHYDALTFHIDSSVFSSFVQLSVLTLDYEFVSDTLLNALDNGCMQRLVIHVHSWNEHYAGTTNRAWQTFVEKNPRCELRLNLIHSYDGVKALDTDIFCPAMPLTHLKVLFCRNINIRALHRLSMWYSRTLKSLTWIDSIDRKQDMPAFDIDDPNSPDPLVLMAWKCTRLTKMVFLGHKYYQEYLLAVARLRGSTLKLLVFATSDITSEKGSGQKIESIIYEIRNIMDQHWMPLSDSDLPAVILNPLKGNSREVIMPLVLSDQK